jgi:hypothetical protein
MREETPQAYSSYREMSFFHLLEFAMHRISVSEVLCIDKLPEGNRVAKVYFL